MSNPQTFKIGDRVKMKQLQRVSLAVMRLIPVQNVVDCGTVVGVTLVGLWLDRFGDSSRRGFSEDLLRESWPIVAFDPDSTRFGGVGIVAPELLEPSDTTICLQAHSVEEARQALQAKYSDLS